MIAKILVTDDRFADQLAIGNFSAERSALETSEMSGSVR